MTRQSSELSARGVQGRQSRYIARLESGGSQSSRHSIWPLALYSDVSALVTYDMRPRSLVVMMSFDRAELNSGAVALTQKSSKLKMSK
jgi:hypothetical protein